MQFIMSTRSLARLDQAAIRAASQRSRSGQAGHAGSGSSLYATFATAERARSMLRQVLRLKQWVAVTSRADDLHHLGEGSIGQAVRLRISEGSDPREFLAAYDSDRCFTLSVIAPCPQCAAPVPTVRIGSLADYGDWLNNAPNLAESPHYRTSPAHRDGCPISRE
ncbi:hypothetical protein [Streptomyces sp. NBC_00582]|uniref:hypothetical protein n=1 Tax=Streptomyces sp. NBC_00582 TaxID=2975783 RepID=UPI002E7FF4C5|nr:hypothetical protein [Streptomyces sp. NBC_00582]WUB68548.1 hypothetical protein OG852_50515 [Streptomyces sp. NBC_00582]